MSATRNARDLLLQAAPSRYSNPPNAAIILTASAPQFKIDSGGTPFPAAITFTATLIELGGPVTFQATGGTLTVAGNVATLTYANMPGATASVSATLTENGQAYASNPCSVTKVSDGASGTTSYTWIKYGTSAAGAGLSDSPTGMTYIGLAHNKPAATESTIAADYSWSLIKGTDGVPGNPGADGVTTYTWLKYSDNADGTGLYDIPTSTTLYIGLAVNKTTATESTLKTDYVWSKFKGDQGVPGTNGSNGGAGPRGAGHFYAIGNPFTDALANAATPGENVVDDVVTVSAADGTYALTKKWTGAAWANLGQVIDGALAVTGSFGAAAINSNGLTIRTPAGAIILDAGGTGLQPGFEAPGTKNTEAIFARQLAWEFRNTLDGVQISGCTASLNADSIVLTSNTADPYFVFPGLSFSGSLYDKIRMRIRRVSGTGWSGTAYYSTGSHSFSESYKKDMSASAPGSAYTIIEWDMAALTAGGTDWTTNAITNIRFDLSSGSGDVFEIDWVMVGKYGPQSLEGVGFTGDPDATKGAPTGTMVGGSLAQVVDQRAYDGSLAYTAFADTTTGLSARMRNNADNVLGGIISANAVTVPAGIRAGNLTWNNAGARTGGYGVAMTPQGLIGYNAAGTLTFFINATNGDAYYAGQLAAAYGSFGAVTIAAGGSLAIGQTAYHTGTGLWFGFVGATPKLSVGIPGVSSLRWDGANIIIENPTISKPSFTATCSSPAGTYFSAPKASTNAYAGSHTAVPSGRTGTFSYAWTVQDGASLISGFAGDYASASLALNMAGKGSVGEFDIYCSCVIRHIESGDTCTTGVTVTGNLT